MVLAGQKSKYNEQNEAQVVPSSAVCSPDDEMVKRWERKAGGRQGGGSLGGPERGTCLGVTHARALEDPKAHVAQEGQVLVGA